MAQKALIISKICGEEQIVIDQWHVYRDVGVGDCHGTCGALADGW